MSERCAVHPDRAAEITCARCGSFACYECVGRHESALCARCRLREGGGAGWIGQLGVLSALTIGHGALVSLLGAMYLAIGVLFLFLPTEARNPGDPPPEFKVAFMACFGLVQLAPGVLQIVAGARMLRSRGRTFAIVALASGMMTMVGCYCFPTSIALAVWGLIVLNDAEVRERFACRRLA